MSIPLKPVEVSIVDEWVKRHGSVAPISKAAKIVNVAAPTIRRYIKDKMLRVTNVGGRTFVYIDSLALLFETGEPHVDPPVEDVQIDGHVKPGTNRFQVG